MAEAGVKEKTSKKKAAQTYAVVKTCGKQYRVHSGDVIVVDRMLAKEGDNVEIDQVLLVSDGKKVTVGTPLVEGARVKAEVVGEGKGEKVIVFKYKPKVRYRRKKGHRQLYTRLAIKEIVC